MTTYPPVEPLDDLTDDEWDRLLLSDWFDAGAPLPPPPSAWAVWHGPATVLDNPAVWLLVEEES